MINLKQFDTRVTPTWCPSCGNFGLLAALKNALKQLNLAPSEVCLFYDIGCSSNMANFLYTYGFGGLHGRSLPAAIGASLANHKLPIIALAGDGGAYGEGLNHFLAACRANYNLTFIVSNNELYSLTTGQESPTSAQGKITKSTPNGVIEKPFNPLTSALVNHGSFVARGYSFELDHLSSLIAKAVNHPGFSFIDVLSPCVTWNAKDQPPSWYQERIYKLSLDGYNLDEALKLSAQGPKSLPLGIFYKEVRATYQDCLKQLKTKSLSSQSIKKIDIQKLCAEFC